MCLIYDFFRKHLIIKKNLLYSYYYYYYSPFGYKGIKDKQWTHRTYLLNCGSWFLTKVPLILDPVLF